LGFIDAVADFINSFFTRLADDSSFRAGFLLGLLVALSIGWLSRQLLYWWGRILQFFDPTTRPAVAPGPSPFNTCVGAIFALIALVGILIFVLLLIARAS